MKIVMKDIFLKLMFNVKKNCTNFLHEKVNIEKSTCMIKKTMLYTQEI